MVDVLRTLQRASWKEIEFPIEHLEFGFSHDTAEHKYIFRNEALIQPLGRKNKTWSVTIPFTQNMARGRWENLYTEVFPEFLNKCNDRKPGVFEAPDLGAFNALCVSLDYTIDPANMRDGVRVNAQFIQAPLEDEILDDIAPIIPSLDNAISMAGKLDEWVEVAQWEQEVPPEPFVDPLTAITSIGDQINANRDMMKNKIDGVAYKIDKMNKSLDNLSNPQNWSLKRQGNNLRASLIDTKNTLSANGKRITEQVVRDTITVVQLAKELGISQVELLKLNPRLAGSAMVRANTKVVYLAEH